MIIREIKTSDAEKLATLLRQVDESSDYMLWEKGERNYQTDKQLKLIEHLQKSKNATIFVAEDGDQLIGYLFTVGGSQARKRHSAYIVIGIHSDARGKGIGTLLFEKLDQWALEQRLRRLELTVVTQNKAGVSLYEKQGFEIEGMKRDSLFVDGEYLDEYYMAKIL